MLAAGTAQAREEHKTPTVTGSTRHVDRSINSSMSASRMCPLTTRHIAKRSSKQLRRVAQSFGGTAARRPMRGKLNHDRILTQTDHLTRMAT